MIAFIDRVKKLLYQIDTSLIEEEYNLVEINMQVLVNLLKEKPIEALLHKDFLQAKLMHLNQITSRYSEQIKEMLNIINGAINV